MHKERNSSVDKLIINQFIDMKKDFLFLLSDFQYIKLSNLTNNSQTSNWFTTDSWMLSSLLDVYFLIALSISILSWYLIVHRLQNFSFAELTSSVNPIPINHMSLTSMPNKLLKKVMEYTNNATNYFQNTTVPNKIDNEKSMNLLFIEIELYTYIKSLINKCSLYATQKNIEMKFNNKIDYISCRIDELKMTIALQYLLLRTIESTVPNSSINITISQDTENWILSISNIPEAKSISMNIIPSFIDILPIYHYGNLKFVNNIIEEHGGNIVGSSRGNVATIKITMPLNCQYQSPEASGIKHCIMNNTGCPCSLPQDIKTNKTSAVSTKPNVLLVMADKKFSYYLNNNLSIFFKMTITDDPEQIRTISMHKNLDIIIIDEIVNGVYGDELCSDIRSDKAISNIPVILLLNISGDESYLSHTSSGADMLEQRICSVCKLKADIRMLINNRIIRQKRIKQEETYNNSTVLAASDNMINEKRLFLEKVEKLLDEKLFIEKYTIADLSSDLCMSRTKFSNKMIEITGKTPSAFIYDFTMTKAKNLLLSNLYTVTEVSDMLGFCNSKYFRKRFKQYYNVCPTEFVKEVKGLE